MFVPGDLAVVRIGNGGSTLTSAATQVFIDEYTVTGKLVQSIALPTTASGANAAFTNSGTATSEGALSLSSDGRYLALAGYNAAVGTASVASTTSAADPRVVAIVNGAGTVDTSTQITSAFSGNNIRGAVVVSNAAGQPGTIYAVGANSGVQAVTYGSGTATSTTISTTPANSRVVEVINGQLYVSSGSGTTSTTLGVNAIGNGTPTTGGQTPTLVAADTATGASPYGFVILGNFLYVADSSVGLEKYMMNSNGTYTLLSETYNGPTLSGLTGLTGSMVNGVATLYGTESSGTGATTTSAILSFVDNGSAINGTTIVTASSNEVFRGIAFAPSAQASTAVPEPASIVLLGLGCAGAALAIRRRSAR